MYGTKQHQTRHFFNCEKNKMCSFAFHWKVSRSRFTFMEKSTTEPTFTPRLGVQLTNVCDPTGFPPSAKLPVSTGVGLTLRVSPASLGGSSLDITMAGVRPAYCLSALADCSFSVLGFCFLLCYLILLHRRFSSCFETLEAKDSFREFKEWHFSALSKNALARSSI